MVCYLIDGPPVPTYYRPIPQFPSLTPKDRIFLLQSVRYFIVLLSSYSNRIFCITPPCFTPCTRQVSLPRPMHLFVSSISPSILPTLPHLICWVGSSTSCSVDVSASSLFISYVLHCTCTDRLIHCPLCLVDHPWVGRRKGSPTPAMPITNHERSVSRTTYHSGYPTYGCRLWKFSGSELSLPMRVCAHTTSTIVDRDSESLDIPPFQKKNGTSLKPSTLVAWCYSPIVHI